MATLIIPQFSSSYAYCEELQWNCDADRSFSNCTSRRQEQRNTSVVKEGSHTQDGVTTKVDSTCQTNATAGGGGAPYYCLNCETLGGYRSTVQGLALIVIAIGLIGFGLYFLPKTINVKV